ncbi:hypothetical protein CHS0354_026488 [Potamilus streckersoni]|uniref:Uncharacterized protein n=1 Tax=Potamilus streckersoni TaxID=2493646 RepID=A0AAE0VGY8_9BIVA|nr:hypothetical protein CHS0354_026488 [Potamilus streckersoni]
MSEQSQIHIHMVTASQSIRSAFREERSRVTYFHPVHPVHTIPGSLQLKILAGHGQLESNGRYDSIGPPKRDPANVSRDE